MKFTCDTTCDRKALTAMNRRKTAAAAGAALVCVGAAAWYKWNFRMPLKEYTRYALYMAALDDEICRSELEGNRIGGKTIIFPPRSESLQDRYRLFLRMNRGKSRGALQAEIARMERRRAESEQYRTQPKEELEVLHRDYPKR